MADSTSQPLFVSNEARSTSNFLKETDAYLPSHRTVCREGHARLKNHRFALQQNLSEARYRRRSPFDRRFLEGQIESVFASFRPTHHKFMGRASLLTSTLRIRFRN
jgi:hypothetical protein